MAPIKVLVVEDDPECLDLLQRALVSAGYRCTAVSTIGAAWRSLTDAPPDIVVLDQRLPDGSGESLCERIRETPATSRVLVAFLTSNKSFADGNDWLSAGGDTCWLKPTSPTRFVALVKGLIRRHAWDGDARQLVGSGLFIDRSERVVIFNGRRSKKLTDRELRFIGALGKAGDALLPRQAAHDTVFAGDTPDSPEPAMNEMLSKLRAKLPRALARAIETVFGKGYRLRLPTPDGDVNQPRIARA